MGLFAHVDWIAAVTVSLTGPRAAAGRLVQDSVGRPGQPARAADEEGRRLGGRGSELGLGCGLVGTSSGFCQPRRRPPSCASCSPARLAHHSFTHQKPRLSGPPDLLELSGSFTGGGGVVHWCRVSLAACRELILFNYVTHVGLVGDSWGLRAGGGQAPMPSSCPGRGAPSTLALASGPQWAETFPGVRVAPLLDAGWPAVSQDFPGPPVTASWEGHTLGHGAVSPGPWPPSWLRLSACTSLSGDLTPVDF